MEIGIWNILLCLSRFAWHELQPYQFVLNGFCVLNYICLYILWDAFCFEENTAINVYVELLLALVFFSYSYCCCCSPSSYHYYYYYYYYYCYCCYHYCYFFKVKIIGNSYSWPTYLHAKALRISMHRHPVCNWAFGHKWRAGIKLVSVLDDEYVVNKSSKFRNNNDLNDDNEFANKIYLMVKNDWWWYWSC